MPKKENTSPYCFSPVKGDDSDQWTQQLFQKLDITRSDHDRSIDIADIIRKGANLHAYYNCHGAEDDFFDHNTPIDMVLAHLEDNDEAVNQILKAFDDPNARKKYIIQYDIVGRLITANQSTETPMGAKLHELATTALKHVLSYLTPEEQKEILGNTLPDDNTAATTKNIPGRATPPKDEDLITSLPALVAYLGDSPIKLSPQRAQEEANTEAGYESGEEALGTLDNVLNRRFTARITYSQIREHDAVINVPTLELIPSDWRLPTATAGSTQGDHVIAYILLLSSLSHCRGEKIKQLPDILYTMACKVLPDLQQVFLNKKRQINNTVKQKRAQRKETIAALKHQCNKAENFLYAIEDSLKRTEIEAIARHVEEVIDLFIQKVNALKGESFAQARKKNITQGLLLKKIAALMHQSPDLRDEQYHTLRDRLVGIIQTHAQKKIYNKTGGITDKLLTEIAKEIQKTITSKDAVPDTAKNTNGKLTQASLLAFIKKFTPLKKYHEGAEVNKIRIDEQKLQEEIPPEGIYQDIGETCARLFDYPCVGDPNLDNEDTLYSAIPRHLIIFSCAFNDFNTIAPDNKEIIYDTFINHLLTLQLWNTHIGSKPIGKGKNLTLETIKENILNYASVDALGNYTMLPSKKSHDPVRRDLFHTAFRYETDVPKGGGKPPSP